MRAAFAINPHRRPAIGEDAPGTPTLRSLLLAMAGLWAGALVLGFVGVVVTYGEWPATVSDAVLLPLFLGFMALPVSLVHTWGSVLGVIVFPLAFLFWPLVLGLHVAAAYRRRPVYLVPAAVLVAAAAWGWTITAGSMMAI